jgi:hypothetical protein
MGSGSCISGGRGMIIGGYDQSMISSEWSTITYGLYNRICNSNYSVLYGGESNCITGGSRNTTINGQLNTISSSGTFNTIIG